MLEKEGYPFKSKVFSKYVDRYRRIGMVESVKVFVGDGEKKWSSRFSCPKTLRYLFTEEYKPTFPISMKCCLNLKEKPLKEWGKKNNKKYTIIGIMKAERGGRQRAECMAMDKQTGDLRAFQPLAPITKEWEDWFIKEYDIRLADLYYEPYLFNRTGCRGCPYAMNLQGELDTLEKFFPNELKVCESVWKPVYDEYRRIGYRLRKPDRQMTLEDYLNEENR